MNIQNIKDLSEQLQFLGFNDLSFYLFQKICFKPEQFVLSRRIQENKDWLNINLFFKKDPNRNQYVLMHYDVVLQKEMELSNFIINGVNILTLDQQMKEIDWVVSFDPEGEKQWNPEDEKNWDLGQRIESIVEQLDLLTSTEEGKIYATVLKIKYWAGIPYQELTGITGPLKNKSEITQRFYLFENENGISIAEAYRFLQNKWMEKQIQVKQKETDDFKSQDNKDNEPATSGNGLLKKKRLSHPSKSKRNLENK